MSKHTPGPWIVERGYGRWYKVHGKNAVVAELRLQATTETVTNADEVAAANAELIASAPDLLAEVEQLKADLKNLESVAVALTKAGTELNVANARLRESERGQLALLRDCAYGSYFHTEIAKRREKIKKFLSKYEEANKPTDEQGAKG